MAIPVGDSEKFRRHHIERGSPGNERATRIGVVAAREFDRGFDQEAAGVVADRAERIVIGFEAPARRLAVDGPGHGRRHRRLVGARRWRQRDWWRWRRGGGWSRLQRHRAARSGRLTPRLARKQFWLLVVAIERIEAGVRGAAGGGLVVARRLENPRRRRHLLAAAPCLFGLIRCLGDGVAGAAQRRRRWRHASLGRTEQVRRGSLGLHRRLIECDKRKACQSRTQTACGVALAAGSTRRQDKDTPAHSTT